MLKWLALGYFLLVLYWIKCMFLSQGRREKNKRKRKNIFQFRKVDKQENPIFKAVYNPKEFRRKRD